MSLLDAAAAPATNLPAFALLAMIPSMIGSGITIAWVSVTLSTSIAMGGDILVEEER